MCLIKHHTFKAYGGKQGIAPNPEPQHYMELSGQPHTPVALSQ
jgi:hypothetical protein